MLEVEIAPYPALRDLLVSHPRVSTVREREGAPLEWIQGDSWRRRIWVGRTDIEPSGLIELMDNNPLVCADEMSVPSPSGTLALIAVGPLARAGLLAESPKLLYTIEANEHDVSSFLSTAGWERGVHIEAITLMPGHCRVMAFAELNGSALWEDIEALYEGVYGRSVFLRRRYSILSRDMVNGQPFAIYRLGSEAPAPEGCVFVSAIADRHGKCGAAQIVHAFNIMAGFEESLGL